MAQLMTDGLAKLFNWRGKGEKKKEFSQLNLKVVSLGKRGEYLWQKGFTWWLQCNGKIVLVY